MAAGQATRMGRDKLLLPWQGTTVLGYVLQTALEAAGFLPRHNGKGLRMELYVVAREPFQTYLTADQSRMFHRQNGFWLQVPKPQPLSETVRCGLNSLDDEIRCIGFLPGDQVGVTVSGLAECFRQVGKSLVDSSDIFDSSKLLTKPDILIPLAGGKTVSPVFFHRKYAPELSELRGEQGGKTVLSRYPEKWLTFQVEEGFARDLDTPEQYEDLLNEVRM